MPRAPASAKSALAPSTPRPSEQPAPLPRLSEPLKLDGRLDESVWRRIPPYPVITYEPAWGQRVEQPTKIRVAYDDDHLYLAAELHDDHPNDVRAGSLYRDRYSGDDTVGLIVDSFNDNRNALVFYTTPAGMRGDSTVSDDMASGQLDSSWNGYWQAATQRTPYGWSAEMKIPFFTLGFQGGAEHVVIGLGVYRWMARTGTRYAWPATSPKWARGYAKPSKLADVALSFVRSRPAVYLSPYLLAGGRCGTSKCGLSGGVSRALEVGGALRTNLLPNLTLDMTANTDFAQVEADDAQVNLTRFPLLFPEKRQFFLDRADIFAFSWERNSRLFHSRRIGLRQGRPLRIYGGTRLAGRINDWDIGLLDMKTAAPPEGGFGENLSVLRVRRRRPDSGAAYGAMLTSRLTAGRGYNLIAATDADISVMGDEFLTVKAALAASAGGSPEVENPGGDSEGAQLGSRAYLRWQRRSVLGLSYEAELAAVGSGYRSDLGFEQRTDVAFGFARATYLWLRKRRAVLSALWGEVRGYGYRRNADGRIDSSRLEFNLNAETPEGHSLSLLGARTTEDVGEAFDVTGLRVEPGSYGQRQASVTASGADSLRFRPSLTVTYGSFYGGHLLSAVGWLIVNPNPHFEVGANIETNDIRLPGDRQRTTSVLRTRLQLALDLHASLMTLVQYNQADATWTVSGRARYNLREGSDLWLVYDELAPGPGEEAEQSRALLLKLNHTLIP